MLVDFYTDPIKNKDVLQDMKGKLINNNILVKVFKITFSYKTKRGNNKNHYRYVTTSLGEEKEDANFKFIEFINNYNKKYQYRPYLNVEILKCEYIGNIEKSII